MHEHTEAQPLEHREYLRAALPAACSYDQAPAGTVINRKRARGNFPTTRGLLDEIV
jgi:hypothetical protein